VTSIQRHFLVDECLSPLLIPSYILPHLSVTEEPVLLRHYRDKFGPRSRWKDPDFIKELARDGRWAVLSGDLGKQGSRLDSLRIACRRHGVTLVCVSASIRDSGLDIYGPQFIVHWRSVMEVAAGPKGGQYQIRFTGHEKKYTAFEPLECPPGFKPEGRLCVPVKPTPVYSGAPVPLTKRGRKA
jgi:hypothetical protein